MMGFHLHFRANRIGPLFLESFETHNTSNFKAASIIPTAGLSGLIEARSARDRAECAKSTARKGLWVLLSQHAQHTRIAPYGYDAQARAFRARARAVRPPSLSSAN